MNRAGQTLRLSLSLLLAAALAGCGPILAQMARGGEGVKGSSVLAGSGPAPKAGSRVVVLSPFAKTKDSFYICRGEDEEALAAAFREGGIFQAAAVHRKGADDAAALAASLKGKDPAKAKEELGLPFEPDAAVTGTILVRKTLVSPLRGVVMDAKYRVSFLDLRTGSTWTVEVAVKSLAEEVVPSLAGEIGRLAGKR